METTISTTTKSVLLAGVGGQGILLASEIVAQTAMRCGFDVKTNEVHGMAQRGGSVLAQVRYGEMGTVHSPIIPEGTASVLGSLELIESLRYAHFLTPGAWAIISRQRVIPVTVSSGMAKYPDDAESRIAATFSHYRLVDAEHLAQRAGTIRAANVVVLGAIASVLTDLPREAWETAVADCVKPQHRDLNLGAFAMGYEIGK
ncbi:MAG: indolepyruvate oxidoreductase subunit beta [Planctomycetia bacterium]|nr:indolepyruvate oxidoreductase subunit beta [Planctomycetia bacterium]